MKLQEDDAVIDQKVATFNVDILLSRNYPQLQSINSLLQFKQATIS
jgi:hypothetical protein